MSAIPTTKTAGMCGMQILNVVPYFDPTQNRYCVRYANALGNWITYEGAVGYYITPDTWIGYRLHVKVDIIPEFCKIELWVNGEQVINYIPTDGTWYM
jgi:hypothetical protein